MAAHYVIGGGGRASGGATQPAKPVTLRARLDTESTASLAVALSSREDPLAERYSSSSRSEGLTDKDLSLPCVAAPLARGDGPGIAHEKREERGRGDSGRELRSSLLLKRGKVRKS